MAAWSYTKGMECVYPWANVGEACGLGHRTGVTGYVMGAAGVG